MGENGEDVNIIMSPCVVSYLSIAYEGAHSLTRTPITLL